MKEEEVEEIKNLERKDGNDGKEESLPHFFLLSLNSAEPILNVRCPNMLTLNFPLPDHHLARGIYAV